MKETTYSEASQNLSAYMDLVNTSHEPVLIIRPGSKPAVLLSLEDYGVNPDIDVVALNEAIIQGLEDVKAGRVYPAEEVFAKIGIAYPPVNE